MMLKSSAEMATRLWSTSLLGGRTSEMAPLLCRASWVSTLGLPTPGLCLVGLESHPYLPWSWPIRSSDSTTLPEDRVGLGLGRCGSELREVPWQH